MEAHDSIKVRGVGSNPTGSTPSTEETIAGMAKGDNHPATVHLTEVGQRAKMGSMESC